MTADQFPQHGFAERLANVVLTSTRSAPPVDLHRIADHLGVVAVQVSPMREDGRTTWSGGRPVIDLRGDRPSPRMRFTLAHELAHVMLARDRSRPVKRTASLTPEREETLCDWIAAALLMPRVWVAPYAMRDALSLSVVRLVAGRAEVSLAAAAVRIAEVGRRTCVLLRWKDSGARWVLAGRAGVPRYMSGYLELGEPTQDLMWTLPRRRDQWHEVQLTSDGTPFLARAHVDRGRSSCVMLLTEIAPA